MKPPPRGWNERSNRMDSSARLERIGRRAADEVENGMIVGLGTGSTASAFVRALGERVVAGLDVLGIATSIETADLAMSLGLPLTTLEDVDRIDLCVDGADEIDSALNVVKGRGGALLHEKLVARRADRYIIIASAEKLVEQLGTRLPLPVEVIPVGWNHTARELERLGLEPALRPHPSGEPDRPYVTDGMHYILDCASDGIKDPAGLATAIKQVTGVVDHGLFVGMVDNAITIDDTGTLQTHEPPGR